MSLNICSHHQGGPESLAGFGRGPARAFARNVAKSNTESPGDGGASNTYDIRARNRGSLSQGFFSRPESFGMGFGPHRVGFANHLKGCARRARSFEHLFPPNDPGGRSNLWSLGLGTGGLQQKNRREIREKHFFAVRDLASEPHGAHSEIRREIQGGGGRPAAFMR